MRAAHQESLGQGVLIAGYVLNTRTWCHPVDRWFAKIFFPTRKFPSQLVRPEPIQVTTCLLCNPAEHARLKRVVGILISCKKTKYCQRHNGLVSFRPTQNHSQIVQAGTKMSNSSCPPVVSYQAVTCHQAFEYNLHASINISYKFFGGLRWPRSP